MIPSTVNPERVDDATTIDSTRTIQRDAFAQIYQTYACQIFRYVRSNVPSDEEAEDITAQVFFKAYRSSTTFEGTGSYQGWLFTIARNCLADRHRDRSRSVTVESIPDEPDPGPTPASLVIDRESRLRLLEHLSRLTSEQREAIALRYLEDLSIDEVAKVTGRTKGAVRTLLLRARNRLRKIYGGEAR